MQVRQTLSSTWSGLGQCTQATCSAAASVGSYAWSGGTACCLKVSAFSSYAWNGMAAAAKTAGSYTWTSGIACSIKIKHALATLWDLHVYPIRAAEITLDLLNTYIADPVIAAAQLTKTYLKDHYGEILVHLVAWSILFSLCGLLGARSLSGLNTITKPMLIGFGPGLGVGIIAGIIAERAGFEYTPSKGGFADKVQRASDNPFLRAAGGATYMLAAATTAPAVGALTGIFLGYMLVKHIVHFPEPEPTHEDRIQRLEEELDRLQQESKSRQEGHTDAANLLKQAASLIQHGGKPPDYYSTES